VERDPGSFAWAQDTDAARFRSDAATWGDLNRRATSTGASDGVREDADLAAHRLNLAVGQCPTMAIHWVTPRQRTVLEEEVAAAVNGRSTPDEAGARVFELLAKAKWENGRTAAPAANKRRAKASTRWVDWY
jgi:ferredoxin